MKFLHAADLHLDSPLRGLSRYEGAPAEAIRAATRRAMENLVALALREQVDFVLISGDIYDVDWKDYNTGLFFARQMTELRKAGIPVFLISGNHDAASQITRQLRLPDNVTVFQGKKPSTHRLEDLGVAIHGHGYAQREVSDNLVLDYPAAVPGFVNIGMLHTSLDGREGHAAYAPCSLDDLRGKGYDYWALGHVHTRETLSEAPWIAYPGNIQGRHIHEDGARGCLLVEGESGRLSAPRFCPLDVVRWHICRIDATPFARADEIIDAFRQQISEEIDDAGDRLLAVRVVVTGASHAHAALWRNPEQWENDIRQVANDAGSGQAWVEKVKLETRPPVDLDALRAEDTPLGSLLRALQGLRADEAALAELAPVLSDLQAKLPDEARRELGLDLRDPRWLADAVGDVEQILLARLSREEGEA